MANNIFDDLCDSVLKLIKKRERDVKQDYKAAYRRLRNKLQKIYADYEDEDDGVKISRDKFKALDREAARIIAQMYKKNETAVQNTLEDVLNTSYESVNTITSKYNIDAVARKIDADNIIKKQVAGHIWTERIKKYGNDFVYDVHGIIHQGLDNGDTYTTTARKLKERFGKDIGNTMRIARTESARVLEDSKYQAFEDLANNDSVQIFKVWHTMGDEAVRDTHDAMEGVKVLYDEDFILPSGAKCQYPKGTGVAAEDINCRCYVEYVTELVKDDKRLDKSSEKWYNINEKEESNKGLDRNLRINKKHIMSSEYDKKFTKIDTDIDMQRTLKKSAREILLHRDGTKFEDLVYIDSKTNKSLASKDYNEEKKAKPTKAMNKLLKNAEENVIIALHNHPESAPPSYNDIYAAFKRKYKYGLAVCHNGDIWYYSVNDDLNLIAYRSAYYKLQKSKYNDVGAFIKNSQKSGVKIWKI